MRARLLTLCLLVLAFAVNADASEKSAPSQPVPELAYGVVPDFFQLPTGTNLGEVSGVAINSAGHTFVFQRRKPMLMEFDHNGKYLRELGDGLFDHPHGLRIDADDNIWTTDDGNHLVL